MGRFVLHYVEMVIAMAAGMVLLQPLWTLATDDARRDSPLQSMEAETLVMATAMSIPMVAWMRFRGHHWAPTLEMGAAMYAGFIVLYPAHWAGALSEGSVATYGHLLMLATMLLAMLCRREQYTTQHHDHDRLAPAGAASDSTPTSTES